MVLLDVQPAVLLESGDGTITLRKMSEGETIAPSEGMPGDYRLTKGLLLLQGVAAGATRRPAARSPFRGRAPISTSDCRQVKRRGASTTSRSRPFGRRRVRQLVSWYTCNLCGLRYQDETKALGQDAVEDAAVKAGLRDDGPSRKRPAARCGKVLQAQETIPAWAQLGRRRVFVTPAVVLDQRPDAHTCTACGAWRADGGHPGHGCAIRARVPEAPCSRGSELRCRAAA